MDEVAITVNQWNQLKQLYVDVPLIYLLGLSASWPNNCKIYCYGYGYNNKISVEGIRILLKNNWS